MSDGNEPSLKHLTSRDYAKLKPSQHKTLQDLVRHHIESFNYAITDGLKHVIRDLNTQELKDSTDQTVQFFIEDIVIGYPCIPESNIHSNTVLIYPSECREGGTTYKGQLSIVLHFMVNGQVVNRLTMSLGQIPIMVKSKLCHLYGLTPKELVEHHEEAEELGGYFIINGNERLIRMLVMPRRNYPLAIVRASWVGKGPLFTQYGCMMRCVRNSQSQSNMTLHHRSDGDLTLAFGVAREIFYLPLVLVLKALLQVTDLQIYTEIIRGSENNAFLKGCVASMLRHCQDDGVLTQLDCLRYIGQRFRIKTHLPPWYSDEAICHHLLKDYICIHLDKNSDKFNLLILMARKTYSLSSGECAPETADSTMNHEILLGGHLYLMILKEKLQDYLIKAKQEIEKKYSTSPDDFSVTNTAMLRRLLEVRNSIPVASILEAFIATGNLRSRTGLNLQQTSGFTVIADKLNFYRYLSHFRAVHRGAFFTQMRTTAVRKFLPEAWGFICPVHTPDGAPCGLLNHLTALCQVITDSPKTLHLPKLLASLGMIPVGSPMTPPPSVSLLSVVLDGCVLGVIKDNEATPFVNQLRTLKAASNDETVPSTLEIACVPTCVKGGQYPGIFLFTTPSRMMRPVINLSTGSQELVGSFEQVYLNIAVCKEEIIEHETTHMEVHEGSILSVIASFTPFSNFNQSPRNIYQCQMGKQTMGTPAHAISFRSDNKLYKLQTPQSPLVRPYLHDHYDIDNYPLGTNAIVAVISYTGYDMEDAMILNRASFHRGFAHATVYKTELIDLGKKSRDHGNANYMFGTLPSSKATYQILDDDGLPAVGSYLKEGDPFYSYIDLASNAVIVEYYKSHEPGYVDQVKLIGSITGDQPLQKVFIKLRLNRNPIIGDKFASRHGQKGICSQKWPTEDMPFAESGMVPDIIFNPHGFPSRMTIGMMIESMAGKSSSLHGLCHDATPFTFSENISAVDHFGKLLVKAGYNYFGNERLYSGIDGREFEADVFFGVVYYQRLRHMVSDKFQVRTTGPIDILTHQPVKGRKRAGGIRFGEMERDALIAHGSSFLLHDRLFNCSDKSFAHVCYDCGSILSPLLSSKLNSSGSTADTPKWKCKLCEGGGHVEVIAIPYVFRYLVVQLAAMNIKLKINTTPVA